MFHQNPLRTTCAVRRAGTIAATAVLVLAVAACGASTATQSGSSETTTGERTNPDAIAAQEVVDAYLSAPSEIAQKAPLPQAPPRGEKFIWLNCGLTTCVAQGEGMRKAVESAGWTYEQINYDTANPATLTDAFQQALQRNPTVVAESGIPPEAGWASVIPAYRAAGVPIIASFIATDPAELPEGVVANVSGPEVFDEYAKQVANWFIADSNGQGTAVVQRIDAYPILKSFADSMVKYIEEGCADCDISTVVQNSAADAGSQKVIPGVVSALQRNKDAGYLLSCDLEFFDGLPSALAAAGLGDVKIAGQSVTLAGQGLVKNGKFAMAPSHPSEQAGWIIADVAFRMTMGLPLPDDINAMPSRTLLPGGDFPTDVLVEEPTDYADQFKALWKVG